MLLKLVALVVVSKPEHPAKLFDHQIRSPAAGSALTFLLSSPHIPRRWSC
jgi:hypothetical protein